MITKEIIKSIAALSDGSVRRERGLFVGEGTRLVGELLASRFRVETVYYTSAYGDPSSIGRIAGRGVACVAVTGGEMARISQLKSTSSILAVVRIPDLEDHYRWGDRDGSWNSGGVSLVLDTVQDPGNMGTIIRIADWFGIHEIFCSPQTVDCYASKVVQATMGAITRVRVHYVDLPTFLAEARKPVYGTFLDGQDIYDAQIDVAKGGYVVMGNEGNGISSAVEGLVHERLHIPSAALEVVESLNVAMATGIICSEFFRRAKM